jgi:hypothetical protein
MKIFSVTSVLGIVIASLTGTFVSSLHAQDRVDPNSAPKCSISRMAYLSIGKEMFG